MNAVSQRTLSAAALSLTVVLLLAAALSLAGCGTPGAPLPPSLKLPDPVTNLTAARTGGQVALAWTMPRRNTDKLLIKGDIPVRVCRKEGSSACLPVPGDLAFAPEAHAAFTDSLPAELAAGAARPLTYFVELRNAKGRSAGPSNAAVVLAGEAPASVAGLSAQVHKEGIVLRWSADSSDAQPSSLTIIRLHRKLLTPPAKTQPEAKAEPESSSAAKPSAQPGILAPPPEPLEQSLLVEDAAHTGHTPDRVLDKTIRFGSTYEYRAQRVSRATICDPTPTDSRRSTNCRIYELPGPLSDPIRVEAIDVFPPEVPTGVAAVATAADSSAGASPSIDLSWQPVTDPDLAGYAVYRREGEAAWQRTSPVQPIVGPAFHDPDVQPGHSYRYQVTSIDQLGHESARSAEAEETVPNP